MPFKARALRLRRFAVSRPIATNGAALSSDPPADLQTAPDWDVFAGIAAAWRRSERSALTHTAA
jgi:hypothetical protein